LKKRSELTIEEEVEALINDFNGTNNLKLHKATHPGIYAYRTCPFMEVSEGLSGSDDCGEKTAGGRILKLLELCEHQDVLVVVTRWYGGTDLGNFRFKAINDVAIEAIALLDRSDKKDSFKVDTLPNGHIKRRQM